MNGSIFLNPGIKMEENEMEENENGAKGNKI